MARTNSTPTLEKLLLPFVTEPDPLLGMLPGVTDQRMRMEAEAKAGAPKGKHSRDRKTHFFPATGCDASTLASALCT